MATTTTLSAACDANDEVLTVASATGLQDQEVVGVSFLITIGSETIRVGKRVGATLYDCKRGYDGTTAAVHASGATVTLLETAASLKVGGIELGNAGVLILTGAATPEAAVTAPIGSLFLRNDGSTSTTLYVKTSGASNTGWTAK